MAVSDGWGQFCTALFFRPLVVSGGMDINGDFGCIRALNPDTGPPHQPRQRHHHGLTVIHLNLLPISLASSDVPVATGHEPFCLSLSHPAPYIIVPVWLAPQGARWDCVFFSDPGAERRALHVGLCILLSSSLRWAEPCLLIEKGSQCLTTWKAGSWFVGRCCWSPLTGRDPR